MPPTQGRLTNADAPSIKRISSDTRTVISRDDADSQIMLLELRKEVRPLVTGVMRRVGGGGARREDSYSSRGLSLWLFYLLLFHASGQGGAKMVLRLR